MVDLQVIPEGKHKVTFVFTDDENQLGVHEIIKVMAHYIKMLMEEHQIKAPEVAISKNDKVEIKEGAIK